MTTQKKKAKRVFKEDMVVESDVFKLEVASYNKNLSFNEKNPVIIGVEHCHIFRTYDSSGKKCEACASVGGHKHEIDVAIENDGTITATCGPAINSRINYDDTHTHKVTYLKSDKLKLRTFNEKAQQVIASYDRI